MDYYYLIYMVSKYVIITIVTINQFILSGQSGFFSALDTDPKLI